MQFEKMFGLRIRRASDLIGEQGREAFWRTGIALDALLTSVVVCIHEKSGQSSTDISGATGLSRQLVEARLKQLEKDGYVTSKISAADARKRTYAIAPRRRAEVGAVVQEMQDFEVVYRKLWKEIGVDLSDAVYKLEKALNAKSLLARLCDEYPEYLEDLKISGNA